jgi:hypothetical protein
MFQSLEGDCNCQLNQDVLDEEANPVEVVEILAPDAEICIIDDQDHQEIDGEGLGTFAGHHCNETNLGLGVVELPATHPGDVGLDKILEDECVDDGVEVFEQVESGYDVIGKIAEEELVPGALL